MARQNTNPVPYNRSVRTEEGVLMSSGYAGVTIPIGYWPLLRGDSCAGRVAVDFSLAEMPRPLLNAVMVNVQAWFVPKSIHPQFNGTDEFAHSYTGEAMKALGQADRTPPPFFLTTSGSYVKPSEFFETLGIHVNGSDTVQTDVVDAFNLVYNFRLQAHSTKLERRKYFSEDMGVALSFPRAFWPSGRFKDVVPDYDPEMLVGSLDLDVSAGRIPVKGLVRTDANSAFTNWHETGVIGPMDPQPNNVKNVGVRYGSEGTWNVIADMQDTLVTASLADIDTARRTQAMAKIRSTMAGNDPTGFVAEDTILAHLMQGLMVPEDMFKRPWLLDSVRVPFGFNERFSTDATALDESVTTGRASAGLSINIPVSQSGGTVIIIAEVLPERLDERQADEWLLMNAVDQLPNALRDIQNPEPVDIVLNRRIDAAHTSPDAVYGYEPLNNKWNRSFTRLGGVFFQPDPAAPNTEQRSAIWQAQVVDPVFTSDHWLAPAPFPHYVFSDTTAPAFEFVVRHSCKIAGNTQVGDVLVEDNGDYEAVDTAGGSE